MGALPSECYNPKGPHPLILLPRRESIPVPDLDIVALLLQIGFPVLSLGVHEAAHAWVAYLCGDPTAKEEGRMTLNPIVHIDLFWSILLPAVLWLSGGMIFGGAKPVPVIASRMRHPARGLMLSALAGPASNFLLALIFLSVAKVLVYSVDMRQETLAVEVIKKAYLMNLVLAAFNMIPIPLLDGSRVLAYFMPSSLRMTYMNFERFGMLIIFGLIYFRVTERILDAALAPMFQIAELLTGGYWG